MGNAQLWLAFSSREETLSKVLYPFKNILTRGLFVLPISSLFPHPPLQKTLTRWPGCWNHKMHSHVERRWNLGIWWSEQIVGKGLICDSSSWRVFYCVAKNDRLEWIALFGIYTRALFSFFKNEKENPHVYVKFPTYLCGSLACPPPLDFLTPAELKASWT
jgi:hypothetical protein